MTLQLPNPPAREDLSLIVRWIEDLRNTLERSFNLGLDSIRLAKTMNEPPKPRDGDVFFVGTVAEGSNWNPDGTGNGGYFGYYGAAWHKLG